jgi:hypothetical protein
MLRTNKSTFSIIERLVVQSGVIMKISRLFLVLSFFLFSSMTMANRLNGKYSLCEELPGLMGQLVTITIEDASANILVEKFDNVECEGEGRTLDTQQATLEIDEETKKLTFYLHHQTLRFQYTLDEKGLSLVPVQGVKPLFPDFYIRIEK